MPLLPLDTATRIALARHLRFVRRVAYLHRLAGRAHGLTAEIAASMAWDAAARELRGALQIARTQEAARQRRERVTGEDPRD